MLKGNNLILKEPSQKDYESLRNVKPSDEFYLMVGSDPADSVFLDNDSFEKSLEQEHYWYVYKETELIGVAFLHGLDIDDKRARYAVSIYNEKNWNKGYGYEITQCVLRYAFKHLKLHKVDLRVLEYNKRAIASYKKNGFVQDGVLRDNAFINHAWHNDIIMSILCHEFQAN
jgi:RimJ/RimL family protein N-acetyltransferase